MFQIGGRSFETVNNTGQYYDKKNRITLNKAKGVELIAGIALKL